GVLPYGLSGTLRRCDRRCERPCQHERDCADAQKRPERMQHAPPELNVLRRRARKPRRSELLPRRCTETAHRYLQILVAQLVPHAKLAPSGHAPTSRLNLAKRLTEMRNLLLRGRGMTRIGTSRRLS